LIIVGASIYVQFYNSSLGHISAVVRGKNGPALASTEYQLMPSACRLIVRAYQLLPCACQLPIELRKLRNQMKQFANPGGILACLPSLNLSHWAQHVSISVCIFNKIHYPVLERSPYTVLQEPS